MKSFTQNIRSLFLRKKKIVDKKYPKDEFKKWLTKNQIENALVSYDAMLKITKEELDSVPEKERDNDWFKKLHQWNSANTARYSPSYEFDNKTLMITIPDALSDFEEPFPTRDFLPVYEWMIKMIKNVAERIKNQASFLQETNTTYRSIHKDKELYRSLVRREARLIALERGTDPNNGLASERNWFDAKQRLKEKLILDPAKIANRVSGIVNELKKIAAK